MDIKNVLILFAILVVAIGCSSNAPAPADTMTDAGEVTEEPVADETPAEVPVPAADDEAMNEPEEVMADEEATESVEEEMAETIENSLGAEIEVIGGTFNPDELEVTSGTTITLRAVAGKHLLIVSGAKSGALGRIQLEQDQAEDITLEAVEQVKIYDIFTKSSVFIEVVEADGEMME